MPSADAPRERGRFSVTATCAALAALAAVLGLLTPSREDQLARWSGLFDLGASLWLVSFALLWTALTLVYAALTPPIGTATLEVPMTTLADAEKATPAAVPRASRARVAVLAVGLLALCGAELALHEGERNPFVATSRPTTGVVDWTGADGYAMVLEGRIAQGDGLFLLPLLKLFLGDAPPEQSEFDRRAGHVFVVSLVARPLGAYWAFAAVNLAGAWVASLAVWRLARRRWPGGTIPIVAAVLTATGQGFVFMSTAPQAHALAFAAFAVVLVLADELGVWKAQEPVEVVDRRSLTRWLRLGWATGAAGLIYLVHLPCLIFFPLYGLARARARVWGLLAATGIAVVLVAAWERYAGTLLGLSFAGGNNDLAREAVGNWLSAVRTGPAKVVSQLQHSSIRGMLVGAFYYPWWVLAACGLTRSSVDARRWAIAVMLAAALPAMAFTTRFNLPRVAYFMYPAVYPAAAAGIAWLSDGAAGGLRVVNWVRWATVVLLTSALVLLTNADVMGIDQLTLWFHHSQGARW